MLFSIDRRRSVQFPDLPLLEDLETMLRNPALPASNRKELEALTVSGRSIEVSFQKAMKELRESPSHAIRELISYYSSLVKNLLHTRIVASTHIIQLVGINDKEGAFSYRSVAVIPTNWHVMYERNPIFELGDIVTLASRARDAYNGKLDKDNNSLSWKRGEAYEAEFIMSALAANPNVFLTDCQRRLIEKWPHGIHNYDGLEYVQRATE